MPHHVGKQGSRYFVVSVRDDNTPHLDYPTTHYNTADEAYEEADRRGVASNDRDVRGWNYHQEQSNVVVDEETGEFALDQSKKAASTYRRPSAGESVNDADTGRPGIVDATEPEGDWTYVEFEDGQGGMRRNHWLKDDSGQGYGYQSTSKAMSAYDETRGGALVGYTDDKATRKRPVIPYDKDETTSGASRTIYIHPSPDDDKTVATREGRPHRYVVRTVVNSHEDGEGPLSDENEVEVRGKREAEAVLNEQLIHYGGRRVPTEIVRTDTSSKRLKALRNKWLGKAYRIVRVRPEGQGRAVDVLTEEGHRVDNLSHYGPLSREEATTHAQNVVDRLRRHYQDVRVEDDKKAMARPRWGLESPAPFDQDRANGMRTWFGIGSTRDPLTGITTDVSPADFVNETIEVADDDPEWFGTDASDGKRLDYTHGFSDEELGRVSLTHSQAQQAYQEGIDAANEDEDRGAPEDYGFSSSRMELKPEHVAPHHGLAVARARGYNAQRGRLQGKGFKAQSRMINPFQNSDGEPMAMTEDERTLYDDPAVNSTDPRLQPIWEGSSQGYQAYLDQSRVGMTQAQADEEDEKSLPRQIKAAQRIVRPADKTELVRDTQLTDDGGLFGPISFAPNPFYVHENVETDDETGEVVSRERIGRNYGPRYARLAGQSAADAEGREFVDKIDSHKPGESVPWEYFDEANKPKSLPHEWRKMLPSEVGRFEKGALTREEHKALLAGRLTCKEFSAWSVKARVRIPGGGPATAKFTGTVKDSQGKVICFRNGRRVPCPKKQKEDKKQKERYVEEEQEQDSERVKYSPDSQVQMMGGPRVQLGAGELIEPGAVECEWYVSAGVLHTYSLCTLPSFMSMNQKLRDGSELDPSGLVLHARLQRLFLSQQNLGGMGEKGVWAYSGLEGADLDDDEREMVERWANDPKTATGEEIHRQLRDENREDWPQSGGYTFITNEATSGTEPNSDGTTPKRKTMASEGNQLYRVPEQGDVVETMGGRVGEVSHHYPPEESAGGRTHSEIVLDDHPYGRPIVYEYDDQLHDPKTRTRYRGVNS